MKQTMECVQSAQAPYSSESLNQRDKQNWCRLIRDRRWGLQQKHELLRSFVSLDALFAASERDIAARLSSRPRNATANMDDAALSKDMAWLEADDHNLVTFFSVEYPDCLTQLPDPPLALFCKGNIELLAEPQVAIVGSRKPSPIGAKVAAQIAQALAHHGVIITSGMALGIDGIGHNACLDASGGSIAVLGCGLDIIYPARHRALYDRLASHGLLVSEYPLGMAPDRYTFPKRNRIVSGLTHGVVIVEAAERSGTLITARLAAEQDREVMVVPGSALSRQYEGSHALLQQGAALVTCGEHVLACLANSLELYLPNSEVQTEMQLAVCDAHQLLVHIAAESTSVDSIILGSGLTPAEVSSMLIELELLGAIAIASDGGYVNLS